MSSENTNPKIISDNKNHKAIDIGSLIQISDYEFVHPKFKTIDKSRLFIGEILETTGAEVSFRELPPNTKVPFLHKHNEHEEIYIFMKGKGKFQVDDIVFDVQEGTIVRVDINGSRTLSNNTLEPLIYMVIQSKAGTLCNFNVLDGERIDGDIKL